MYMFLKILCVLFAMQTPPKGIVGLEAPSLQGVEWVHTIDGVTPKIGVPDVTAMVFQHYKKW
jgi:hypothetical protein